MGDNLKLHIGCGDRLLKGFINIDIEGKPDKKLDVRKGLPFKDNSVSHVFSDHFIEYLWREKAVNFIEECYRVLKPGGVCRIATPDLDDTVETYIHENRREREWIQKFPYGWIPNRCVMLNLSLRERGPKYLFNYEDLKMAGALAGFILARRCELGQSDLPELAGIEGRADSIVVEFIKESQEYKNEFPLVSITVPAYTPHYLEQAIRSAIDQTYLNKEIIVCNDNPSSRIKEIVESFGEEAGIRYRENPRNIGAIANYIQCFEMARGTYIKFLNDDDLLAPGCAKKMVSCFEAFGERVSLVTSKRNKIDAQGRAIKDDRSTAPLVEADSLICGTDLGNFILRRRENVIGEPSTFMFRKKDLENVEPSIFSLNGAEIHFVVDVVMGLKLLAGGDAVYISEPLSCLRVHQEQEQQKPSVIYGCLAVWPEIVRGARALGFLQEPADYAHTLATFIHSCRSWRDNPDFTTIFTEQQQRRIAHMKEEFESELSRLASSHPSISNLQFEKFSAELKRIRESDRWLSPLRHCHIRGKLIGSRREQSPPEKDNIF